MPQSIEESSPLAIRCRELLRQVAIDHREAVRRAGQALVAKGASDQEALAATARDTPRFRALAQTDADRLAATIFAGG